MKPLEDMIDLDAEERAGLAAYMNSFPYERLYTQADVDKKEEEARFKALMEAYQICLACLGPEHEWCYQQIRTLAEESMPCAKCGQVDIGQTGEYPCPECGLPNVWDDINTKEGG